MSISVAGEASATNGQWWLHISWWRWRNAKSGLSGHCLMASCPRYNRFSQRVTARYQRLTYISSVFNGRELPRNSLPERCRSCLYSVVYPELTCSYNQMAIKRRECANIARIPGSATVQHQSYCNPPHGWVQRKSILRWSFAYVILVPLTALWGGASWIVFAWLHASVYCYLRRINKFKANAPTCVKLTRRKLV